MENNFSILIHKASVLPFYPLNNEIIKMLIFRAFKYLLNDRNLQYLDFFYHNRNILCDNITFCF